MSSKDKKGKKVKTVSTPHDNAFEFYLREKETARSFLEEYLPAKIIRQLDFNSLRISKDKFVDKEMSRYFSDLLYEIKLNKKPAFIYLLFEHKSWSEWFICLQLLKYMVNIWELFLKQNKKAKYLPVIIPLVIYHGRYKWKISKKFISLFKNTTDLEKYIPDFSYNLYDISHIPDEEIKGTVKLRILFTALKYIFTPELKYKVPGIFKLLREIKDKSKGTEYLEVLLRYISRSAKYLTKDEIMESVSNILKDGGELMQTIAEQWIEQGVEKNKWEVVKNSLRMGLNIKTIAEITGLPVGKIEQMKSKINLKEKVSPS